jgi:hypothetical protein
MEKISSPQDSLTGNSPGQGSVTREQVHARTLELASLAGREPPDVAQSDYEQAKRDLGQKD